MACVRCTSLEKFGMDGELWRGIVGAAIVVLLRHGWYLFGFGRESHRQASFGFGEIGV